MERSTFPSDGILGKKAGFENFTLYIDRTIL